MMHESNECEILKNQNMEMNKVNNTPFKAEDVNWDELAWFLRSCGGYVLS